MPRQSIWLLVIIPSAVAFWCPRAARKSHSVAFSSRTAAADKQPLELVRLTQLELQNDTAIDALCTSLKRDHVVLIELAEPDRAAIASMWNAAAFFFAQSAAAQAQFGPLHEASFPPSSAHCGQSRMVGFTRSEEYLSSIMDFRLRRCFTGDGSADSGTSEETHDRPAGSTGPIELIPRGMDTASFGPALVAGQRVLSRVGLAALSAATADLSRSGGFIVPGGVGSLVDLEESLRDGVTSATVHRLAYYDAGDDPPRRGDAATSLPTGVSFDAHTDGTWFTVIPCAAVPGMEVLRSDGWCQPEVQGRSGIDVAVLSGDFLQSLSKWEYESATHRVLRPPAGGPPRLSAPVLLRASPQWRESGNRAARAAQLVDQITKEENRVGGDDDEENMGLSDGIWAKLGM